MGLLWFQQFVGSTVGSSIRNVSNPDGASSLVNLRVALSEVTLKPSAKFSFFDSRFFRHGPKLIEQISATSITCDPWLLLNPWMWGKNLPVSFFTLLTSKCASRHNSVHFFDIATSKSGRKLVCFVHFDFKMCFAPQRRAIFHVSSGQLASAPAALASLLFDPPEPQIIGKTQCFATFLPFRAPGSSFFWDFLFLPLLFSDSSHLCFSSVHIVGSLTSKLPSIKQLRNASELQVG